MLISQLDPEGRIKYRRPMGKSTKLLVAVYCIVLAAWLPGRLSLDSFIGLPARCGVKIRLSHCWGPLGEPERALPQLWVLVGLAAFSSVRGELWWAPHRNRHKIRPALKFHAAGWAARAAKRRFLCEVRCVYVKSIASTYAWRCLIEEGLGWTWVDLLAARRI